LIDFTIGVFIFVKKIFKMIIQFSDRQIKKDITLSVLELKALYNLLDEVPDNMKTYKDIQDKIGNLILEHTMDVFDNPQEI
jgi:hypothetical protein